MNVVSIVSGKNTKDMLFESIDLLGGIKKFVKSGDTVLIKPNVCGGIPGKKGSYTSPEIISALIEIMKNKPSKIIIGESDSEMYAADLMFDKTGIREVANHFGADVVNLGNGELITIDIPDAHILKKFKVSKIMYDADVIISVPVVKTHIITDLTLNLKCMYGILPEKHKAKYHKLGVNKIISDVYKAFPPHLCVVDATVCMEGEGPFNGNSVNLGLIICGDNAISTDSVTASVLCYKPHKIKHIKLSAMNEIDSIDLNKINIVGQRNIKKDFKKTHASAIFNNRTTDYFISMLPENKLSAFFHKYYESAVFNWSKKDK